MNDASTPVTPRPDSDLLERYVLRRVTDEERTRVEGFVRSDPGWRAALEHEQRLVAGIRRVGQLELKRRLADRLLTARPPAFPWIRTAAAAAVLVLLLSVALVNRWFAPRTPDAIQGSDGLARLENAAPPPTAPESNAPEPGAESSAPAVDAETKTDTKDRPQATTEPGVGTTAARERGAKPAEAKSSLPAPTAEQTPQFWAEAHVLPPRETQPEARRPAATAKSKEELALMQKGEQAGAVAGRGKETDKSGAPSASPVRLHQLPLSSLDAKQQTQFRTSGRRLIPALIEQRNDSLHITLFTEAPIDESLLNGASVEQVAPDSFVISLPGETLGLQLPRGIESQQATRGRR